MKVFAPASVGNVGPGFDVLGMAVAGLGDTVTARLVPRRGVHLEAVTGAAGLPLEARKNTAGIAAQAVLRHLKARTGVALRLHKRVPGTGLGSSAASAVAAGYAVNALLGFPLDKEALIPLCARAEAAVSGAAFMDNIGAAMLGGVILVNPVTREAFRLGTVPGLVLVLASPEHKVLTRRARAVLPARIPLEGWIANMARACTLVHAVARRDPRLFGRALQDTVVEPHRAPLIPGFVSVKRAALKAGALGCVISGAGSTVLAVTDDPGQAPGIGEAMARAFRRHGLESLVTVTRMDARGARVVS